MRDRIKALLAQVNFEAFYRSKVRIQSKSGNELHGHCPLHDDKESSWSGNTETGLWKCFGCSLSGTIFQFIEKSEGVDFNQAFEILANSIGMVKLDPKPKNSKPKDIRPPIDPSFPEKCHANLLQTKKILPWIQEKKGLSLDTIRKYKLGWDGERVTIPVCDEKGILKNIRRYSPTKKPKILSYYAKEDGKVEHRYGEGRIFGVEEILARPDETVHIFEGEWDKLLGSQDGFLAVTGTVGAQTWKPEWTRHFKGRHIIIIYDMDDEGIRGAENTAQALVKVAASVTIVKLPLKGTKQEKDYSDFRLAGGGSVEDMKKLIKKMPLYVAPSPSSKEKKLKPVNLKEVLDTFGKWLELEETHYIEIIIATLVSNQMPGDPVWLFVIAPPGASKTEVLRSFNKLGDKIYITSKLTAHSLISGKKFKSGYDPSLLPKLNKKTLIIKDFTAILGIQREERQTIFSDLREAFDGYLGKDFGNIGHKGFSSHFSLIAAVTPVIDKYVSVEQELGERFLKVRLAEGNSSAKIARAIENVERQGEMREELANVMERFLSQRFNIKEVSMPQEIKEKIVKLANFIAVCRTHVSRDPYQRNILTYMPEPEVGTRIGIQLSKLAKALAAIAGKDEIGEREIRILERISNDTMPKKRMLLLYSLFSGDSLTTSEIVESTGMEGDTCRLALNDLQVLRLVAGEKTKGQGNPIAWKLTEEARELT